MAVGHHPGESRMPRGRQDGDHLRTARQTQLVWVVTIGPSTMAAKTPKPTPIKASLWTICSQVKIGKQGHNRGGDGAGAPQGAAK